MHRLAEILGADGELSQHLPGFRPRVEQLELAQTVGIAIASGSNALLEAGTGTGKTFAYLLPLLLSGRKCIVSTGTKNLQDQLFYKDLPLILNLIGKPLRVALLKGRANYVCPQRLDSKIREMTNGTSRQMLSRLVEVRQWSTGTRTGDLTELSDFHDDASLVSMVTSSRDNCLGSRCPKFVECPLYRARDKAREADLIVVNHHLLFADLALRDDGLTSILPDVTSVVIDEAHQVTEVARQFFGSRISSGQLTELARDLRQECRLLGDDDPVLLERTKLLQKAVDEMSQFVNSNAILDFSDWIRGPRGEFVDQIDIALGQLRTRLDMVAERSTGLQLVAHRLTKLTDLFTLLTEPLGGDQAHVHWLQLQGRGFVIHLTPVSIASELAARFENPATSWVFTSATLAVANSFEHIKGSLGLDDLLERQFESPFDYQQQVLAYVPENLPTPGTDEHTRTLIDRLRGLLERNLEMNDPGKFFMLFTSHRALRLATDLLSAVPGLMVFYQGQFSKSDLIARYRQSSGSVLLATGSFWEGVDLRGADLRCLVIDKLPFASPDEPLPRALMAAIDGAGGNGFMDYLLPQAIIALKQGFGRLIRQEADTGLFILGDPRVMTKPYGRMVMSSLPDMEWSTDEQRVSQFMEHLTITRQAS